MVATLGLNAARAMLAAGSVLHAVSAHAASIAGRVVDESGRPLAGVRVMANEVRLTECSAPSVEARSTVNGEFSIDVPPAVFAVVTEGFSLWNPAAVRVDARGEAYSGSSCGCRPDFLASLKTMCRGRAASVSELPPVSATDASGARKHFARQIVLQGEEMQMPDQKPAPPRRRVVR